MKEFNMVAHFVLCHGLLNVCVSYTASSLLIAVFFHTGRHGPLIRGICDHVRFACRGVPTPHPSRCQPSVCLLSHTVYRRGVSGDRGRRARRSNHSTKHGTAHASYMHMRNIKTLYYGVAMPSRSAHRMRALNDAGPASCETLLRLVDFCQLLSTSWSLHVCFPWCVTS